jgi:DUF2075 family protein
MKTAAESFAGRQDFLLLDEQMVAYELVLAAVEEAGKSNSEGRSQKKVVIVRGGPGSGKSAVAITLLSTLARRGKRVLHATGSRAFTETLRKDVAGGDERSGDVFKYFNDFDRIGDNSLDVLVCDEAHRVRADPRGRPSSQIARLIDVAKVPVFLLDENQVVRPNEIGTMEKIVEMASLKGCLIEEVRLDGQFRCGGSAAFDEWALRLLGIVEGGPIAWSDLIAGMDDEYVVDWVESPHSLETWLTRQARNFSGTARIAAGFCWDWSDPVRSNGEYRLVDDVVIGGWRWPWNVKQGREAPGFPSASYWASDPAGFGQVGCIYTAQGFEYDWAGVIFGNDFVIRDGRWRPYPKNSQDKVIKGVDVRIVGHLIRNTYKVLMTRGMQGVCLYSVDPETNDYLRTYCR